MFKYYISVYCDRHSINGIVKPNLVIYMLLKNQLLLILSRNKYLTPIKTCYFG